MVITEKDKTLINNLHLIKGYGLYMEVTEFPGKGWKMSGLDKLLLKLCKTGTSKRKYAGSPRSMRNERH